MSGAGVDNLAVSASGMKAKIDDKDGKVTKSDFCHGIVAVGIVPNTETPGWIRWV